MVMMWMDWVWVPGLAALATRNSLPSGVTAKRRPVALPPVPDVIKSFGRPSTGRRPERSTVTAFWPPSSDR